MILSPAKQNTIQRVGFFAAVAAAIVIFVLHYPFGGYDYQFSCEPDPYLYRDLDPVRDCGGEFGPKTKPLLEWTSLTPVVPWLGSMEHLFVALATVALLAFGWLWIFQTKEKRAD